MDQKGKVGWKIGKNKILIKPIGDTFYYIDIIFTSFDIP